MERFKDAMGFVTVGLLPLPLCGFVYLAEVLGS